MKIEQMLEEVRINIDDESALINNVGNRPHYPVFVSFYGANKEGCMSFFNTIAGTWSNQIFSNLLLYKYVVSDNRLEFYDPVSENHVEENDVFRGIESVARSREIFDSLNTWCLFNIVDTSTLDYDEFLKAYNALDNLKYVIDESVRSMMVIVLRDSRERERKATNFRIREFLANNPMPYDGLVILSNRSKNGAEHSVAEIYRAVANVVLLADNDAVSSIDDDSYRERNFKLYSKTPYSIAYTSFSKPTKEILACMTDVFVSNIKRQRQRQDAKNKANGESSITSTVDIGEIIGIKNGKFSFFADYIKSVQAKINRKGMFKDVFQYLPMVSKTVFEAEQVTTLNYSAVKGAVFSDALKVLVDEYCQSEVESPEFGLLFDTYKSTINSKLNLLNVKDITAGRVGQVFSSINKFASVREDDSLSVYFINLVIDTLTNNYIYPKCISLIQSILDAKTIKQTDREIDGFINEITELLPTAFDDIPKVYGNYMQDYLLTDDGYRHILAFLKIGNTYDDLLTVLREALFSANEFCKGQINKPFIELYGDVLKLQDKGDMFVKIKSVLDGDGDNSVMLRGEFPVLRDLSVYMLHCYDSEGNARSWLFDQLKSALSDTSATQFFNTSNDDAIESVRLYKIEGNNLIVGLRKPDWYNEGEQ